MLFFKIGEALQEAAVNRSKRSITSLMDIRPDFATVMRNGDSFRVHPSEIKPGESIIVKPGEKIPLDGIILSGCSALDTSILTGESMPRDVQSGDEVLSGSINLSGLLTITVNKEFVESTVSKILALVQDAGSKKAPEEKFITKFARYYTPVVVFSALALAVIPVLIIPNADFSFWLRRALVFLVASCPCALVISIPLSIFGGIGGASRHGILIKNGSTLTALNNAETVVFDKTGTLTKGIFSVNGIYPARTDRSPDIHNVHLPDDLAAAQDELLFFAAAAEYHSNHPIAVSVRRAYGKEIDQSRITLCEEKAGRGIRAIIDNKTVLAGNRHFLEEEGVEVQDIEQTGATLVYIAVENIYAGCISIGDELKPESKQAVSLLRKAGVTRICMFTGDSKAAAEKISTELGLDAIYAELLPHQKVEQLEKLEHTKSRKGKLIFVGDGINDAPVLARSDIGIAMGGAGSDAAVEAADIVLMTDEPTRLVTALAIAQKTKTIIWQNIIFALAIKVLILTLGAFGIATMWEAVFGDVGVALIAVANAIRAARFQETRKKQQT